jgi:hypothetical protein
MIQTKSQFTAVFTGCIRNCESTFPAVLSNIERISSLYSRTKSIFVENDSTDRTKSMLSSWCDKNCGVIINLDGLALAQPIITARLAHARQQSIKILREYFSDYSHLIVLDFDEVNGSEVSLNSIGRAIDFLQSNDSFAGVFANQNGLYYDMWAFRHSEKCPVDVWEEVLDCAIKLNITCEDAFQRTLENRIFSLPPDAPPLEVDSAFGGFGIYKVGSVLRNPSNYVGCKLKQIPNNNNISSQIVGFMTCEHVSFNAGFSKINERLFILPYLINSNVDISFRYPASACRTKLFDPRLAKIRLPDASFRRNDRCPCGSGKKYKHCHGTIK